MFPNTVPTVTHRYTGTGANQSELRVDEKNNKCHMPFHVINRRTGKSQWNFECLPIPGGKGKKWCGLEREWTPDGLWGLCSPEEGKHTYNTKPGLGCLTVKLNGNIVIQKSPLQATRQAANRSHTTLTALSLNMTLNIQP